MLQSVKKKIHNDTEAISCKKDYRFYEVMFKIIFIVYAGTTDVKSLTYD